MFSGSNGWFVERSTISLNVVLGGAGGKLRWGRGEQSSEMLMRMRKSFKVCWAGSTGAGPKVAPTRHEGDAALYWQTSSTGLISDLTQMS